MFTGLIADRGEITQLDRSEDGVRLTVASSLTGDLREGDSVAVNGVCLTATDVGESTFGVDVMNETLTLSSLGEAGRVRPGSSVNLELALRPADRLGGHVVQGHVDGTGTVVAELGPGPSSFTVSLIPETLQRTNLGQTEVGVIVNLEVDVLAKYVERLVIAR